MTNLARKWIVAIQNSLLDALLVRLWLIVPVLDLADSGGRRTQDSAGAFLFFVLLGFLGWVMGFLAIHERPKGRWALERMQNAPINGFEVWSVLPAGGLKPPPLTKAIVMALGQPRPRRMTWLSWGAATVFTAAIVVLSLSRLDQSLLKSVSPSLADPDVRAGLSWGVLTFMLASILRGWAVHCRERLEADVEAGGPFRGKRQGA
jgi:hypothetical protein